MSWNTKWSKKDYAKLAQILFGVRGRPTMNWDSLDRMLNREPGSCKKAFWRICNDAVVNRDDRRVYDLACCGVIVRMGRPFTKPTIDYISYHVVYPNGPERMSLDMLAYYTGHDVTEVEPLICRKLDRWILYHVKKKHIINPKEVKRSVLQWLQKELP